MKESEKSIISLSEASKIAGKSVQTLKRWVKEGKLADQRVEGDRYSPITIRRDELMEYLSGVSLSPVAETGDELAGHDRVARAVGAFKAQVNALELLVDELRGDKKRLLKLNDELSHKLEEYQRAVSLVVGNAVIQGKRVSNAIE